MPMTKGYFNPCRFFGIINKREVAMLITFDYKYLIVFLTGVLFGFFFLFLVYLYTVILALNRKKRKIKKHPPVVDEIEIALFIKDAQATFKDKQLRNEAGLFAHLKTITADLSLDIASKYYPTSKYPLLELTIEETLLLSHYIANRIDEFLSAKMLSTLKRRSLAQLKNLYDQKVKLSESKIVKASQEANVKSVGKTLLNVLNMVNPAYWIKKVTVDKLYDIIIVKIGLAIIAIVGEETYKIYSKSVFIEPVDIESSIDELYESIKGDLNESI